MKRKIAALLSAYLILSTSLLLFGCSQYGMTDTESMGTDQTMENTMSGMSEQKAGSSMNKMEDEKMKGTTDEMKGTTMEKSMGETMK